ncbi:MAG: hypothetical protein GC184_09550 [Rhizobiales bacterium]|nr:hypothetical protein [Hyphomicrobiales bacterium]
MDRVGKDSEASEASAPRELRLQRRPELEKRILAERVRLLYGLGATNRWSMFFIIAVIGLIFWPFAPLWTLIPVLAVQALAQFSFDILRARFHADPNLTERAELWGRRYAAVTLISGTTWSLGAYLWLPSATYDYQIIYLLVLACLAMATAVTRATYPLAVVTYVSTCCAPTVFWLIATTPTLGIPLAVMGSIFLLVAYGWTRKINESYVEAMQLRFENADLVESMMRAHVANEQKRRDAEDAEWRARATAQSKDEFLSLMTDEIATPLDALDEMTQRLENNVSEQGQVILRDMRDTHHFIRRLIADVVDFSDMEAQSLDLKIAPFDPANLVRGVVRIMRHQADAKGLSLELDLSADTPELMIGDADRVRQIMVALIANAIQLTEQGGIVLQIAPVFAPDAAAQLRFSVSDTGAGLSPDEIDGIFYDDGNGKGSLSLTICDRLVQLMGGRIGVDSTPGMGSRFWFLLPVQPDQLARPDQTRALIDHAFLFEMEREMGSDSITNHLVSGLELVLALHRKVEKARIQRDELALGLYITELEKAASAIGMTGIAQVAHEIDRAILAGEADAALKDVPRIQQKITASWRELAKAYPSLGG